MNTLKKQNFPIYHKKKFLKFPIEQQHKKCAEILRLIYENIFANKPYEEIFNHYITISHWIGFSSIKNLSLNSIANTYHQHLKLAKCQLKEHNLLPSIRKNDRTPKKDFGSYNIFLDNIRSAYNVGSILRTTEALRLGSLYFSKNTPYIDNDKVIKTSMGASQLVPCVANSNIKDISSPIIVIDTSDEAFSYSSFIFPKSCTLVLGNEEYGVSEEILKLADYIIEVPMLGAKNSINVACAYAIIASEIIRQNN